MNSHSGILIICDNQDYSSRHILQILTKSRKLAQKSNTKVILLCIGSYKEEKFKMAISYGVDTIIFNEQKELDLGVFSDVASQVIREINPELILIPASTFGKSVAAILSTRFEVGLTADCIDIEVTDTNDYSFSRAALNSSIIAKIQCINCDIKMGTIKKDIFIAEKTDLIKEGEIQIFETKKAVRDLEEIEVLESIPCEAEESIDISKYQIIFAVGRGVKKQETMEKIYALAERCGAGVVGTRPLVEDGIIEEARQVGQSGKSISPRIYIGLGISGASQHMVGIKNAGIIIAVNNDENAAILEYADYPIVANVEDIVEEMEKLF